MYIIMTRPYKKKEDTKTYLKCDICKFSYNTNTYKNHLESKSHIKKLKKFNWNNHLFNN
jgi:hypothetical protein